MISCPDVTHAYNIIVLLFLVLDLEDLIGSMMDQIMLPTTYLIINGEQNIVHLPNPTV